MLNYICLKKVLKIVEKEGKKINRKVAVSAQSGSWWVGKKAKHSFGNQACQGHTKNEDRIWLEKL